MAKRELITREDAIKTVSRWIKADMTLGSSLFEMMMSEIPATTEQDIVKPYLEKFNTLIREHHMNDLADDEMSNFERDILNLIDNLLSESEGA